AEDVPAGFINSGGKLPGGGGKFGANTGDLGGVAGWLKDCGVATVAAGAGGGGWVPLLGRLGWQGVRGVPDGPPQTEHGAGPAQERRVGLPMDSSAAQLRFADGIVSAVG